jgi:hypothetical protein
MGLLKPGIQSPQTRRRGRNVSSNRAFASFYIEFVILVEVFTSLFSVPTSDQTGGASPQTGRCRVSPNRAGYAPPAAACDSPLLLRPAPLSHSVRHAVLPIIKNRRNLTIGSRSGDVPTATPAPWEPVARERVNPTALKTAHEACR